jgi:putative transcriptional regulator
MSVRYQVLAALASSLVAIACQAQDPRSGDLLIAAVDLDDPEFAETVLLVLHHDDDGSLAVFLNRPTWVEIGDAFPTTDDLSLYQDRLYRGGPVAPTQLLALHDAHPNLVGESTRILDDVYLSTNFSLLSEPANWPDAIRLYAGHAAWAPAQLAEEVGQGFWRVLPGRRQDIFHRDSAALWEDLDTRSATGLTAGIVRD